MLWQARQTVQLPSGNMSESKTLIFSLGETKESSKRNFDDFLDFGEEEFHAGTEEGFKYVSISDQDGCSMVGHFSCFDSSLKFDLSVCK